MDNGKGQFIELEEKDLPKAKQDNPNHGEVFHVGQIVSIGASQFMIKKFYNRKMVLKLLQRTS